MSNEPKRVHGWTINTPIPMAGGGVAFVVGEQSCKMYPLAGYRIDKEGAVYAMSWTEEGRAGTFVPDAGDLDPSHRALPEPELPLWTIADSEALLGKAIRQKHRRSVSWVHEVHDDGHLTVGGVLMSYRHLAENYAHLNGTPIPQRRMP